MHLLMTAIITHLLSQLTNRYIALPDHSRHARNDCGAKALAKIQANDWNDFLENQIGTKDLASPWVATYIRHFRRTRSYLIKELLGYRNLLDQGSGFVTFYCAAYPQLLREIRDPPSLLFGRGNFALLTLPKLAIVGSRRCSHWAKQQAFALGKALAREQTVVVSGGAFGCDFEAHRGALAARTGEAPTIAIMAGGLSQLYPKSNQSLFEQILQRGGLFLSERLWETLPRPWDFPVRNRIIAGLVGKVVLIEAPKRSGAMVTANLALEQGRDVMVLKPRDDVRCEGIRHLLDQGAQCFLDSDDFFRRETEDFRDFYL